MLAPLFFLALPILLSALPAAPRFTPNAAADALTLQKMASEKHLIKLSESQPAKWMTMDQINQLHKSNVHFVDMTYTPDLEKGSVPHSMLENEVFPTTPTQQEVVKPIIALGTTDLMKSTLKTLSEFNNRYYRSSTGAQSAEWLFGQVKQVAADSNSKLNVTVTQFKHDWGQHSIIARIEGKNGNQETVILGAHQDSINGGNPMSGRSPGADDDGSGSVTVLEAFRMILASGYEPLRPLEFHWYAGEEGGLLGSRAIAQDYKTKGRQVAGMLQMDMTMFPPKVNPHVGILTDNTTPELVQLLRGIVGVYTGLPTKDFKCGYGCSDHASWFKAGYPTAFPAESSNMRENPNIHTARDSLETVNYDNGLLIAKVAVGFAVELSHS